MLIHSCSLYSHSFLHPAPTSITTKLPTRPVVNRFSNSLVVNSTLPHPSQQLNPLHTNGFCSCGRRHFIGASGLTLLPTPPSNASDDERSDSKAMLKKIHPPRPDWYEEFYAIMMEKNMKSYEAEVSGYKAALFTKLRGKKAKVLELGIGTGPNLKYYGGGNAAIHVFGVDPNKSMEKYARAAAEAAGWGGFANK